MVIHREHDKLKHHVKDRVYGEGPCMANSISWMLGVQRASVPNFTVHDDFWLAVDNYLFAWGLHIEPYVPNDHNNCVDYVIYTGTNVSGNSHMVVCDTGGNLLYDSFSLGGSLETNIDKWVVVPYKTEDADVK